MRAIFLIFFLSLISFGNCQEVKIELSNAKVETDRRVMLTLKIINDSGMNYVINNNFTFENPKPGSIDALVKINLFAEDTINLNSLTVKFESMPERNTNLKKQDVFFIKGNSEEIINICLNDYLSEAEKIGLGMKIISENDLSLNLAFYQSGPLNITDRKISARIRKEKYVFFSGQIETNKVSLVRM